MESIFAGVIILNYLAYNETINCINDFKKHEVNNNCFKYIIVDNASPNESFDKLKEVFKNDDDVFVIKTEKNLGFANGNNFGYEFLKKNFIYKYVIFSNDDILLPNQGLVEWINDSYNNHNFGLLGPDVYSTNGQFHQSPISDFTKSLLKCNIFGLKCNVKIVLYNIKKIFIKNKKNMKNVWINEEYNHLSQNKTLHGSFIVMSHNYLDLYETPFDPRTFLYMEENILKNRCDNKGIITLYNPNYQVHHLQAVSTDKIVNNWYSKQIFRLKHMVKSLKVYKKVLKNK